MIDTKQKWLDGLVAGDQIALSTSTTSYRLHKVDRRTPSRQIVLNNGMRFDRYGRQVGNHDRWSSWGLYEVTSEILEEVKRRSLLTEVNGLLEKRVVERLSNEQLQILLVLLKGEKKEETIIQ